MENYIPTYFETYELCSTNKYENRIKLCEQCEHLSNNFVCTVCHCAIFHKSKYDETKCPIGTW